MSVDGFCSWFVAAGRHVLLVIRILFIGDIVGRPGRDKIAAWVPRLREKHKLDFVVANGENAAAGAGITGSIARTLLQQGVDAITLGDHVWDQRGWEHEIDEFERVCRPANLPESSPGRDHVILEKGKFRSRSDLREHERRMPIFGRR